jgi:hypothetical protein
MPALRLLAAAVVAAALVPLSAPPPARAFDLVFGSPDGPSVTVAVERPAEATAIRIETRSLSVAGSKVALWVDRGTRPLASHVFTDEECRFPDGGSSVCATTIAPGSPEHAAVLAAFKAGLKGRVTVETGGVMRMDRTVSLIGFTKAVR